ncbi:MAG: DUF5004 domain-containing protein [Bacteroidetes bacterium]|nr:DUF5004 domain-containing protein [Bacteroidota bacterium]
MKYIYIAFAFSIAIIAGCAKEKKQLDPRYIPIDAISGSWVLDKAVQTDTTALVIEESDITDFYKKGKLPNFNLDKATMKFTSDTVGAIKKHFIFGGKWTLDDVDYPTALILDDNAGNQQVLRLKSPVRPIDQTMKVAKVVNCPNGDYLFTYIWTFKRK